MRRHRYLAAVALSACLGLQGCPALIGVGGVAAFTSLEDRRTAGTQLEDSGIESRAITRINERIGERAHVKVTVYNRALLLTGEAWDEATRTEIENIARALPNVRAVTNEIQVAGLSSATSRANDTVLTARVKGRFLNAGDKAFGEADPNLATAFALLSLSYTKGKKCCAAPPPRLSLRPAIDMACSVP